MIKHKLKIIIPSFLIIFSLSIFFYYQTIIKNQKESKQIELWNYVEKIYSWDSKVIENFSDITSSWEILELRQNINSWNFEKIQKTVEKIISKLPDNSKLDEIKKTKKVALKYLELWAILNEANYYYKEKEVQKEVENITKEIKSIDKDLFDNFYWNYYLGYSKEIIRDFTWALDYYNKALNYSSKDNKYTTSTIYNQIWHLYDLRWDMNKAYEYYFKAYNLNKQNYWASTNIARYLHRIWEYKKAKDFFLYSTNTKNTVLKSEIYFSLSSIELELNWLKPDIDKSIEYAKLSIQSFPDYPMWYFALARWYYMLNDRKYDKLIEENLWKSIKLNPNWFAAYKYYALHMFDLWNIKKAFVFMNKSTELIDKDVILMFNQKTNEKKINFLYYNFLLFINNIKNKWDKESMVLFKKIYNDKNFDYFINLEKRRKNNWMIWNLIN